MLSFLYCIRCLSISLHSLIDCVIYIFISSMLIAILTCILYYMLTASQICYSFCFFFFFNDTATTYIYTYGHTLSLHDALPIYTLDTIIPILTGIGVAIAVAFSVGPITSFANALKSLYAVAMANPWLALATVIAGVVTSLYFLRDQIKLGIDETTTLGDLMRAVWEGVQIGRAPCREGVCTYG